MRISTTAVIGGLALAVIVPSTVQASRLANNHALSATPATADGTPGAADSDPLDAPVPAAVGEPAAEVSQAADSSPVALTPNATGSDRSTSKRSHGYPRHQLTVPALIELGYVQRDDVLVDFVEGGGFGPGGSTDLTVLKTGYASVTSGRLDSRETWSFTLSRSRLEQLKSALKQAHFRSLRSRYAGPCPDCGLYSITYAGRTVQCAHVVIWEPGEPGVIPKRLAPVLTLLSHLTYTPRIR
jgi:hypothetical protein